jgi:hypothetical protein
MSQNLNLLENHEWFGQFWSPDQSIEFPGKLTYTPKNGVQLECFLNINRDINNIDYDYIHGSLNDGKDCILIGKFNPYDYVFISRRNVLAIRQKFTFKYCIFDYFTVLDGFIPLENFATDETPYSEVLIDFSNFQEFCYPQRFKKTAPIEKVINLCTIDDIEYSIFQDRLFDPLPRNCANMFHSENDQALEEITTFFESLHAKYPHKIGITNTVRWLLKLSCKSGLKIDTIGTKIFSISELLSLLLFYPVRPVEILLEIKPGRKLNMLTKIECVDNDTLNYFQNKLTRREMPINVGNICLGTILENWFRLEHGFQSFIPKIANNFFTKDKYEIRAEIVLLLAQIEKVNKEIEGEYRERYDYPINVYASKETLKLITDSLQLETEPLLKNIQFFVFWAIFLIFLKEDLKFGTVLSELRSEIAHFGKPIKLLDKLEFTNLVALCRGLDLIIASHIYKQLEIEDHLIIAFQQKNVSITRKYVGFK